MLYKFHIFGVIDINPQHIKVLRRDKEGMISAELDVPNQKSIPVSPKYYEAVAKGL